MVSTYILPLADSQATLAVAGGKGASLARLSAAGLPVPDGFHVTTAAYKHFVSESNLQAEILAALDTIELDKPSTLESVSQMIQSLIVAAPMLAEIAREVAEAYEQLPGNCPQVAVRSSATAEDLPDLSFAGQQETYLNVAGMEQLIQAVKRCWASLWTARAIGYRAQHGIDSEALSLAVVVQLMIPAEASGVLFTANPVNGHRDQALINAAWGLGEAIVGGQVTPDSLIVEKATGRLVARDVADKQQMTIGHGNGTETQPVPDELRAASVLDDNQAVELVRLGQQIETLFAGPMDIEWTLKDGRFEIVQARPITALPEPEAPAPVEWPLPDPGGRYMRTSIIDLMPDPLSPLFGTMGLAAINAGLVRLTRYMGQSEPIFPEETLVLINDYAYMEVKFTAREWWWMLTRMVPRFPGMVRTSIAYWQDEMRPKYVETLSRWQAKRLDHLKPAELLAGTNEVLEVAVDHLGSLMLGTMGISAGTEGLFTRVYERLVQHEGDPPAASFLMGYDSVPIQAEKSLYDLATWCAEHEELAEYLSRTSSGQLARQFRNGQPPAAVDQSTWQKWQERFQAYLDQYGHIIYDLDFASPLPLDDPRPMLDTCKMFLRGAGSNPHERQSRLAQQREQATEMALGRLKRLRRLLFNKTLSWAQTRAKVREDGIADIGLGYPVLRKMFGELGQRFVQAGAIEQSDDVYWLIQDEVETAVGRLERGLGLESLAQAIAERKAIWRAEKKVTPPPQLPGGDKYLGLDVDSFLAAHEGDQSGNRIKGLGASPGRVMAPACILHGPEDFDEFQDGQVLVASITTPAWTPLFARATAIVTDVGGPLSHGSIVAREYGIPAVLGTGVATRRIQNGQMITVDGDAGLVILPNGEQPED